MIAKRYAKSPVSDEAVYQKKLQITREYMRPDMEVLEFGCGTGSTAIAHAGYVKHIRAIDFSARMLGIARDKADAAGIANISFEQAGIEELKSSNQAYDVVMGHSILHLLADKKQVIASVFQMLKPGGVFVSSTACIGGKNRLLKLILPVGNFLGLLPLVRFFTADELVQSILDTGFRIEHQWLPDGSDAVFIVAKKPD